MYPRRSKSRGYSKRPTSQRESVDILSQIISYVNSLSSGNTTIENLHRKFAGFQLEEISSLILNNPGSFFVEPENKRKIGRSISAKEILWVKTDLSLCEKHCRRGIYCSGGCKALHLCRTFLLLGDKCCRFNKLGGACSFGHRLNSDHNMQLLSAHNLTSLSENELRVLFRRRLCRTTTTMPQICIYYNGKGRRGCTNNKSCKSLHLCLDFVRGRCYGLCNRNHSMSNEQVAYVLDLYAIDKSWPDDCIVEDLRAIMEKRVGESSESDVSSLLSTSNNNDHDESDTDLKEVDDGEQCKGAAASLCCSHCMEMRKDLDRLSEKMKKLEQELFDLKASSTSNCSADQQNVNARELENNLNIQ